MTLTSLLINSYSPLMFELETDESSSGEARNSTIQSRFICALSMDKTRLLRKLHSPFQFFVSFIIPIVLVCFFNISNIRALLMRKRQMLENLTIESGSGELLRNSNFLTQSSASPQGSHKSEVHRRFSSLRHSTHFRDSNRATNILIFVSVCFVGLNLPFVASRVRPLTYLDLVLNCYRNLFLGLGHSQREQHIDRCSMLGRDLACGQFLHQLSNLPHCLQTVSQRGPVKIFSFQLKFQMMFNRHLYFI